MSDPDYVVIRVATALRGTVPPDLDGKWFDLSTMRQAPDSIGAGTHTAVPAGRFEVREDGAVAEVWELRRDE
jgi:hypothetical protein